MDKVLMEKVAIILEKLTGFSASRYVKADLEAEYRKLQHEILLMVFDEEHVLNSRLTIWDAYNQLHRENEESGHVADELLIEFREGCRRFSNLIRAEISGNRGEAMMFEKLNYLKNTNKVVKNVQLTGKNGTTELDAVVFKKCCAFIIEVKNTRKNVFIDETGAFYRVGEYNSFDSCLLDKMEYRERLLREKLSGIVSDSASLKVVKLVVFTNNRIEVHNKCKELQVCFLAQLPYIIEDTDNIEVYSDYELNAMSRALLAANETQKYEIDMDMDKFKNDFAKLFVTLEENSYRKEKEVIPLFERKEEPQKSVIPEERQHKDKSYKWALGIASCVATFVGLGTLYSRGYFRK